MQNICNQYIQVDMLNCQLIIFYRFFNGNLMICLKRVEQCYTVLINFLLVNDVMKDYVSCHFNTLRNRANNTVVL